MKKIGKLAINAEKVIKNEELVNLRGGYDDSGYIQCTCYFTWADGTATQTTGACGTSTSCTQCGEDLESYYGDQVSMIDCE